MSTKHPWEYKQPATRSTTTKEEFEKMVKKIEDKEKTHQSDMFVDRSKPKMKSKPSPYKMIDGIPHKMKDGQWTPLTKL